MTLGNLELTITHEGTKHTATIYLADARLHALATPLSRQQFQSFAAQVSGELERWPVQ